MSMLRLVFIVEGDAEQAFINRHLVAYLSDKFPGIHMHAQKIATNRKKNIRGGNVSYLYFKNELSRTAAQGNVMVTTLLDFFRLPNDYPCFSKDSRLIDVIQSAIRNDCRSIIPSDFFLPYIQKHEFETLLFANYQGFSGLLEEKDMSSIMSIVNQYKERPEDINGGDNTAPSKRLLSIFQYDKVADSALVLSDVRIDSLRSLCPRFNLWVGSIEQGLALGHFL